MSLFSSQSLWKFNCTPQEVKYPWQGSWSNGAAHRDPGGGYLTHWGQETHICISKISIIGSDNGLLPGPLHYLNQCWDIDNFTPRNKLWYNINRKLIHFYSFKKMHLKMSSGKWRPSCLSLNVLNHIRIHCFLSFPEWSIHCLAVIYQIHIW